MKHTKGFTLIEMLVVVVIIAFLFFAMRVKYNVMTSRAQTSRTRKEMLTMITALELYKGDNNGTYPPDVNRNIPPGIEPYIQNYQLGQRPRAPYPNSVFDRDHRDISGQKVVQLSIRFCPVGATSLNSCAFPAESRADGFDLLSASYYCISGVCRSHNTQPVNYPGYCYNCTTP